MCHIKERIFKNLLYIYFYHNILIYMFFIRENKRHDAELGALLFALFLQTFQG